MEPNPSSLMLFMLSLFIGLASSSYISNNAFESSGSIGGRNLLQAKTTCPINFQDQNYTVITSQCKGPNYNPKLCCDGFKQFACPYADQINDLKSDCATTMFSYINLYGRYPPGLFSNLCKDGADGLECADVEVSKSQKSGVLKTSQSAPLLVLSAGFSMLLYNLF